MLCTNLLCLSQSILNVLSNNKSKHILKNCREVVSLEAVWLNMEKSTCFVCRKRSKWFYENILYLRTKHSERTITAVMKTILGETSVLVCSNPAAMCFKCVSRINEYDEAYEKMQIMEREFKSMLRVNTITKNEDADDLALIPIDYEIADANEVDDIKMDADKIADTLGLDTSNGPDDIEQLKQPEPEPQPNKISSKKKKTEFNCEECKKSFRNKQGLMVNWGYPHSIYISFQYSV